MSKFLRKAFPILVFYAAAGLVKIGLYYIADAFGMNTSGALFQLLVATFVGFFLCAICWQLGSLIKTKFPTVGCFLHITAVAVYTLSIILAFINIFHPVPD